MPDNQILDNLMRIGSQAPDGGADVAAKQIVAPTNFQQRRNEIAAEEAAAGVWSGEITRSDLGDEAVQKALNFLIPKSPTRVAAEKALDAKELTVANGEFLTMRMVAEEHFAAENPVAARQTVNKYRQRLSDPNTPLTDKVRFELQQKLDAFDAGVLQKEQRVQKKMEDDATNDAYDTGLAHFSVWASKAVNGEYSGAEMDAMIAEKEAELPGDLALVEAGVLPSSQFRLKVNAINRVKVIRNSNSAEIAGQDARSWALDGLPVSEFKWKVRAMDKKGDKQAAITQYFGTKAADWLTTEFGNDADALAGYTEKDFHTGAWARIKHDVPAELRKGVYDTLLSEYMTARDVRLAEIAIQHKIEAAEAKVLEDKNKLVKAEATGEVKDFISNKGVMPLLGDDLKAQLDPDLIREAEILQVVLPVLQPIGNAGAMTFGRLAPSLSEAYIEYEKSRGMSPTKAGERVFMQVARAEIKRAAEGGDFSGWHASRYGIEDVPRYATPEILQPIFGTHYSVDAEFFGAMDEVQTPAQRRALEDQLRDNPNTRSAAWEFIHNGGGDGDDSSYGYQFAVNRAFGGKGGNNFYKKNLKKSDADFIRTTDTLITLAGYSTEDRPFLEGYTTLGFGRKISLSGKAADKVDEEKPLSFAPATALDPGGTLKPIVNGAPVSDEAWAERLSVITGSKPVYEWTSEEERQVWLNTPASARQARVGSHNTTSIVSAVVASPKSFISDENLKQDVDMDRLVQALKNGSATIRAVDMDDLGKTLRYVVVSAADGEEFAEFAVGM